MPDVSWVAIGRQAGAVRGYALAGGQLVATSLQQTEADVLDELAGETQTIVRIGQGEPDTAPCQVLSGADVNLPAVTQDQPADVLGGWVRLWIAGFLSRHENWDGVFCVEDGDVTHWVHVSADEIVSFTSFLTLRLIRTLGGSNAPDANAIADSQSRPERLAAHLRQAEVTGNADAITGHLIGAELTAARVYWLGQQLVLISPRGGNSVHTQALSRQEVPFTTHTPGELIGSGLAALAELRGLATSG